MPDRAPYPGLRSFKREETDLFFGRDDCTDAMVERLAETHFLAVLGSSGTGKSSLVRTGLLSGLDMGLMEGVGSNWRVVEFRPRGAPLRNLARQLLKVERSDGSDPDEEEIASLRARLKRGPRSLIERCRDGHLPDGASLLLLVDQFEELFRYENYAGREEAEAFVALLLESARTKEFSIYVTITMRSEYLGACSLIDGLADAINTGLYLTPRMTREECEEAIRGPAAVCGVELEDKLVNRVLNDLANLSPWDEKTDGDQLDRLARRADQLPLLQYTLNRMWVRATEGGHDGDIRLTLAEYERIGGLGGALNGHANEILGKLSAANAVVAEKVFRALTGGSSVADAARHPTQLQELIAICDGDEAGVRTVVDAFRASDCNFLHPEFDPKHPSLPLDEIIDISHESLIRQWGTLSAWLEQEGEAAREWRGLKEDTERNLGSAGELLRGQDLARANELIAQHRPNAAWAARYGNVYEAVSAFLAKSNEAERRRTFARAAAVAITILVLVGAVSGGLWLRQSQVNNERYERFANHAIDATNAFAQRLSALLGDPQKIDEFKPGRAARVSESLSQKVGEKGEDGQDGSAEADDDPIKQMRSQRDFPLATAHILLRILDGYLELAPKAVRVDRPRLTLVVFIAAVHPDRKSYAVRSGMDRAFQLADTLAVAKQDFAGTQRLYSELRILGKALRSDRDYSNALKASNKAVAVWETFLRQPEVTEKDRLSAKGLIARGLYEAAQVLSLMNKPDDAVATYKRALDEIKDQTKNLWGLTADINKSIAEIYRANANKLSGEAQTEARRNAIAHFKSAIGVVYTEFPKKWMRVSALAQNESRWIAAIERLIGGLKNSRQRGEWERVVQSEKNWQFELKKRRWLAERYTDLGNLYKEENQIHEARVAHTLAVERRYNLVARDEAEIKRRSYDNESARRLLADAMRDTAFLEKEDRLPNAVRLSAICVDVMADLAGRQDAKPANQQMIGHCYRLAGSSHASLVKRNSNDKSEETRHRMAALAAYRQSADFYQKAAQDKRYTQAAHNAILMQRNVASMLIALGELQKAVEAGEKAIRMSEEGYKERKNDEARDDLASSYGIGSWYALVSRQPDKARRYAEDALRLAKGDPRKPDTYYTTLSAINLAHALLFLGKTKEAEEIYIAVKDLQMGDRLVVDEIKNDFATLRRFDYVVPAMCKIGKLIDDKTYSQSECAAS